MGVTATSPRCVHHETINRRAAHIGDLHATLGPGSNRVCPTLSVGLGRDDDKQDCQAARMRVSVSCVLRARARACACACACPFACAAH